MLELLVLGALGLGLYAFVEASRAVSAVAHHIPALGNGGGTGPSVTPGGSPPAAPGTFPIPNQATFTSRALNTGGGQTSPAAFQLDTQKAMAEALSAREWRVTTLLSAPNTFPMLMLVGPPTPLNAANSDVLTAARLAASAGQNIFFDADMALKLSGALDKSVLGAQAANSATFMMFDPGVPGTTPFGEEVALSPASALAAIQPGFVGSRFVLFAQAGETF